MTRSPASVAAWPALPLEAWADTYATLHLWTQIVGKVRLAQSAWRNHSWQVTLYVTPNGLTTGLMPCGARTFSIDFDFVAHRLVIRASDGGRGELALEPQSVADFYRALMDELRRLGLEARIHGRPNELPDPIPFALDETHRAYDCEYAQRFWRILSSTQCVLETFRADFIGKCSPVHFFWGAADLAVTRFSGRRAPQHPGGIPYLPDSVAREAYSHEVSSAGFWPGGGGVDYPAFYSYAYPQPPRFAAASVAPADAFYSEALGEFLLPYDAVRASARPEHTLLAFLRSTYVAAADLGGWDRAALERTA